MKVFKPYVNGKFITTNNSLIVTEKYTNQHFAKTYLCDKSILNKTITFTNKIKTKCKDLTPKQKHTALTLIYKTLEQQKNYFAELISKESAKPLMYALAEVERSIVTFKIASDEVYNLPKESLNFDVLPNGKGKKGTVKYFPIGVVAGISPFNFPLNLAVHKIAPAIASGCPIILKPASTTPLSILALAKIIAKTKLPKGMVNILPMNREVGNCLVTNDKINLISFTGSPEVGWAIKNNCGKKKIVLELGGNAATIISKNCKPNLIIDKCIMGAFAYSGQICIHAQRFYVHNKHYNLFLKLMKEKTEKLISGNPISTKTQVSVMIDEQNAIRAEKWTNKAIKQGAKLICGGKRNENYFEPTILTNTNKTMLVNAEEVFAPIICVEKYSGKIENAITKVNDSKFGLQCGVFTSNKIELNKCFDLVEVGGIIHNHVPTLRFDNMPYGGIKESGLGREGIKYAIQDMLEPKVLVY
ncbi:MAG: aldehyde dehydrogenase family protein [Bacteroidia bacterium]